MEQWLDCTISLGEFTGGYAVKGQLSDGTGFSLFAEKNDIKFSEEPAAGKSINGAIRVLSGLSKDDLVLVTLPRPTFENGQTITVKKSQIKPR